MSGNEYGYNVYRDCKQDALSFDYVYEAIKYAKSLIDKKDFLLSSLYEEISVRSQKDGILVWYWCLDLGIDDYLNSWQDGEIEKLIKKVRQQKKENEQLKEEIKQLKLQIKK